MDKKKLRLAFLKQAVTCRNTYCTACGPFVVSNHKCLRFAESRSYLQYQHLKLTFAFDGATLQRAP